MTKWKYQARVFTEKEPEEIIWSLKRKDRKMGDPKLQDVTDTYFVGSSDIAARVRGSEIKIKGPLQHVDPVVCEVRDDRYYFPVDPSVIKSAIGAYEKAEDTEVEVPEQNRGFKALFGAIKLGIPTHTATLTLPHTKLRTLDDIVQWAKGMENVRVVDAEKHSRKYGKPDMEVELTTVNVSGITLYTVCIAANDPKLVHKAATTHRLMHIPGGKMMEYAQAIREYSPK